jgi:hypothetical protein
MYAVVSQIWFYFLYPTILYSLYLFLLEGESGKKSNKIITTAICIGTAVFGLIFAAVCLYRKFKGGTRPRDSILLDSMEIERTGEDI